MFTDLRDGVSQLRIRFIDAEIVRTRLKLEIDLMWEVVSSAQVN
ncbi:hypothetical protein [Umezawaea beigongshangensis]|nr:hypothetical protein [Umezawaea beigongshangensis]